MQIKRLYIYCHYSQQPPYNTMLRFHNWGKQLVKKGIEVTIIAASVVHNTDIDVIEETGKQLSSCEGVNYFYIKTPKYVGNGTGRVKNMLSYCLGISSFSKHYEKPDVIVSSDAYIFPFVKRANKGIPIVVDITDLWPISIIQYNGISKLNPIIQLLYAVEKTAYLNSDAIVFSMEGGVDYINERHYGKHIKKEKIFHINMGCDLEECDRNRTQIREPLPWNNSKTNVVYCGSIRKANQVKEICEAADVIMRRGIDDIQFQIYGNGDELETLKKYVHDNSICNVNFYGRIEKAKIPYILSQSDVNILTYKKVDLMKYGGSQSKLFDYLASGKPIISNADWGYNLITRYNCGLITPDQTPKALADTIEAFSKLSEDEKKNMGLRAREVAELYSQPILVEKLCQVLEYVLEEGMANRR